MFSTAECLDKSVVQSNLWITSSGVSLSSTEPQEKGKNL